MRALPTCLLVVLLAVLGLAPAAEDDAAEAAPATSGSAIGATAEDDAETETDAERADAAASDPLMQLTIADAEAPVGLLVIDGEINPGQGRYLKRAVADARAAGVQTLITHIKSYGGHALVAADMLNELIEAGNDGIRTIAFVDRQAISAGALIAYGHQEIYLTPTATIGDIGVIHGKPDNVEIPEDKMTSPIRALLVKCANNNGWNRAALVSMTDDSQALYRFDLADGPTWVLSDDLDHFLSRHEGVSEEDAVQIIPEGKLLTLDAREAVTGGDGRLPQLATGLLPDFASLYDRLGVDRSAVQDFSPTPQEKVSWVLMGLAPILLSLTILFVIFEIKTAGVGLFATLAGVCLVLFIAFQFSLDLMGNWEIVAIGAAIVAIVLDLLVLGTGGLLAGAGVLLFMVVIFFSFMPTDIEFQPGAEGYGDFLTRALWQSSLALFLCIVAVFVALGALPHSRLFQRLTVRAELGNDGATSAPAGHALVGRRGTARCDLHPGGYVEIDGMDYSASAKHGQHIAAGTRIEVLAYRFGECEVRPVEEEPAATDEESAT